MSNKPKKSSKPVKYRGDLAQSVMKIELTFTRGDLTNMMAGASEVIQSLVSHSFVQSCFQGVSSAKPAKPAPAPKKSSARKSQRVRAS